MLPLQKDFSMSTDDDDELKMNYVPTLRLFFLYYGGLVCQLYILTKKSKNHYKLSHHSLYFSTYLFVKIQKVTKIVCS